MKLSDYELYEECRAAGLRVSYSAEHGKVVIRTSTMEQAQLYIDIVTRIRNKYKSTKE